jgi:hypothetical protein
MKEYKVPIQSLIDHIKTACDVDPLAKEMAEELLKEQEKKQITLHKKHVITWRRNDEFSMRKLYEAICEKLLDEGELFIARTDDHEKVDFVFYVAEGR